ncbi:MAG: RdgB/HAM1 family non-canonical purine NTP pyrophosphatase [Acidimicrobiia bacterium]|nr:RdgB/HAM1 family non-canonical purine NTP pyrophosphatase [Acidimicrobiia bacterium]MDH4308567.1 RdgB/HAM1 family non-canonical purine NTP pyrophosphatase [Acidimicrobiia bacterium]
MIDRLVVASKNRDKIEEMEDVLVATGVVGEIVRGLDWPDVDETEPTLEGNALLKAKAVERATGLCAVADDTGLEVLALGGAPGVYTARYAGPEATYDDNVTKLLDEMSGFDDRRARFRTAVALVGGGYPDLVVEGSIDGVISRQRRGAGGFGYDPVFEVDGETFAEMGVARKNVLSHRARAIRALVEALSRRTDP